MATTKELSPIDAKLDRANYIPTNIIQSGLMSTTSDALTCFTEQKFSTVLQMFLIQYNMSITSWYSIYK